MKILAVQNRMGIGDTIIFLPFIKALSEKFDSPISLLVKESAKADQYLFKTKSLAFSESFDLKDEESNNFIIFEDNFL